jgi:hypothetical protein
VGLSALLCPVAKRLAGVRRRAIFAKVLGPGLTPALAAGALGQGLRFWHAPESWLALIAMAGAVVLIYTLVLLTIMPAPDRADLIRAAQLLPVLRRRVNPKHAPHAPSHSRPK